MDKNDGYTALQLFQYPKRKWDRPTESIWYENRPLGINKLGDMMKTISSAASLSQIYTNHPRERRLLRCGPTLA